MFIEGCLVLVGKDIELDAVGRQFESFPYHRMLFPNCRGIKAAANPRLTFNMWSKRCQKNLLHKITGESEWEWEWERERERERRALPLDCRKRLFWKQSEKFYPKTEVNFISKMQLFNFERKGTVINTTEGKSEFCAKNAKVLVHNIHFAIFGISQLRHQNLCCQSQWDLPSWWAYVGSIDEP